MATPTIRKYLRVIHILEGERSPVIRARVAERMGVSAASLTSAVRRMERDGHVKVNHRQEIILTEKGRDVVESVERRRRLLERLLTEMLGLDSSKAHEEACRLEHTISPEVEEKLSKALEEPEWEFRKNSPKGLDKRMILG